MTKEEELQKLYVEFQVLGNTIKQLEKQHSIVENQLMELRMTEQNLDEMKTLQSNAEILVPISSGIYAKALLKDSQEFIVNVGANVTLKKNIDDTKKILQGQIEELKNLHENLAAELQKGTSKAAALEQEMNTIASAVEK